MDLLALFPLPAVLSVSLPEFLAVSLMVLPEFLTASLMVLPEFHRQVPVPRMSLRFPELKGPALLQLMPALLFPFPASL